MSEKSTWVPNSFVIIRKDAIQLKRALVPLGIKGNYLICNIIESAGVFLELEARLVSNPESVGRVMIHHSDVVCIYSNPSGKRLGFAQQAQVALSGEARAADKHSHHA